MSASSTSRSLRDARRVVVVDLGFGDAGKGTVTDFLARELEATAVVRFNGGAQAGHTVVTEDGRCHTFAQLGAASFVPGVRTFLSKHVVVHPTALAVEAAHLARAGVPDALARTHVSEGCLVTTPVHQAVTRLRELARGEERHGSCGVGVGETMRDALADPVGAIRAVDLRDVRALTRKALAHQESKRAELAALVGDLRTEASRAEQAILTDPEVCRVWAARAAELAPRVVDDGPLHALLAGDDAVVFEGAQGVLLDEWRGFHPFTTWSTCTWDNAEALLREHASPFPAYRLGVLRSFATRHGHGPFPTETDRVPPGRTREHNVLGPWQGAFRTGWLDLVLTRYALAAAGPADGLAVTHLDRLDGAPAWPVGVGYEADAPDASLVVRDASGVVRDLRVGMREDLGHTERLGKALGAARPVYRVLESGGGGDGLAARVVREVEAELGVRVTLTSAGPTAGGKRLVGGRG